MPPGALGRQRYGRPALNHLFKELLPSRQHRLRPIAALDMGLALGAQLPSPLGIGEQLDAIAGQLLVIVCQ